LSAREVLYLVSSTYNSEKGKEFWAAATTGGSKNKPQRTIRVSLPAGKNIKLLNMAEVSSTSGVTVELNLPFPMSEEGLNKMSESIRRIGGTVEFR
jgi:hypothetical protein